MTENSDSFPIYGSFNIVVLGNDKSSLNDYLKALLEKNFPDDTDYFRIPFQQIYTPLGQYGINLSITNVSKMTESEMKDYIENADEIWYFFSINQPESLTSLRNEYIPKILKIKKGVPSFLFGIGCELHDGIGENDWQSKYGTRIVSKSKVDEFIQDFDLRYEPVSLVRGDGVDAIRGRINQIVIDGSEGSQIAHLICCGMENKVPTIPNDFVHSLHIRYDLPIVHVLPIACECADSITSAINTFKFTRNIDHITPIIFIGIYENDEFGSFDEEISKATKNFAQVSQIKMKYPIDEAQIEECVKLVKTTKDESIEREKQEIEEKKAFIAREEEKKRKEKERLEAEERKKQEEENNKNKKKESTCCRI